MIFSCQYGLKIHFLLLKIFSDKLKQSKPDPNLSKSVYASDCSTYCDIIYKGADAMIVDIDMFDDEDEYHFE